jgi:hypothetical protein
MAETTSTQASFPFVLQELDQPNAQAQRLFMRSFRSAAPDYPRHFIAVRRTPAGDEVSAYIHFTAWQPGVFLCGGLCVDTRVYRRLTAGERKQVADAGSLSRWCTDQSILALGPKRAVFAYTGDHRSRRDGFAIGSLPVGRYLIVQWHDEPLEQRDALVRRVEALGAF